MQCDEDFALALQLQEQFQREDTSTKPSFMDVPGSTPVRQKEFVTRTSSLVDPSWEMVDPTPDVHAMFIQFNKRFFWGKLDAVEVRWSPRMTSCAGVCCYQGRSGMCSVRLSVPLLKLRPRKDLVETLLHEMIHAYLFVTHNDRDRDGHGPEFHKHMNRINKEAGTRISVYHDFHDEVKLYKQHWWRCDGPCQNKPPYFGMVKRAMNRAPGPNDLWWADHQATCGGRYIKVREPEGFNAKKGNKSRGKMPTPTKGNIHNYFPFLGKGNILSSNGNLSTKQSKNSISNNVISKPKPIATLSNSKAVPSKTQNSGNGFKKDSPGLPGRGSFDRSSTRGRGQGGGMLANKGSGTLVVTGKGSNRTVTESGTKGSVITTTDCVKTNVFPFSGEGYKLGASTVKGEKPWLARLDKLLGAPQQEQQKIERQPSSQLLEPTIGNNSGTSHSASPVSSSSRPVSAQFDRMSLSQPQLLNNDAGTSVASGSVIDLTGEDRTEPKKMTSSQHELLKRVSIDSSFHGPSKRMRDNNITKHEELTGTNSQSWKVNCPSCNILLSEHQLNTHLECCLKPVFTSDKCLAHKSDCPRNVKCPICNKDVKEQDINTHIDECMQSVCDNEESSATNSKEDVCAITCPMCNKEMGQGDLEHHLETCIQSIFDTVAIEDDDEEEEELADSGSYPCPCCGSLVKVYLMNKHLDSCLSIDS